MLGGDIGFALNLPAQLRHAPAGLGGVDQTLPKLLDDAFQLLRQLFEEGGVGVQSLVNLGANRVLHQRGPRLVMRQVGNLLLEFLVQDRQRLHQWAHLGVDARVDQTLDLRTDIGPIQVGVLAQELGARVGANLR